jgi:nucleoside-diphosphate-sugar epimerase
VVYGPWDEATLILFRLARAGIGLRLGGPAARLAFVHVEDFADAVTAGLAAGIVGTHAVDDGRPGGYGWNEAFTHLACAVGTPLRPLPLPAPVVLSVAAIAGALGRLAGGAPLVTLGKAREALHPDWTCDGERLAIEGWSPRIGLAEGFASAARWYRENGLLRPPPPL